MWRWTPSFHCELFFFAQDSPDAHSLLGGVPVVVGLCKYMAIEAANFCEVLFAQNLWLHPAGDLYSFTHNSVFFYAPYNTHKTTTRIHAC